LLEEEEEFGAVSFDPAVAYFEFKADNITRWYLVYYMIERVVVLKDPLDMFIQRYSNFPIR